MFYIIWIADKLKFHTLFSLLFIELQAVENKNKICRFQVPMRHMYSEVASRQFDLLKLKSSWKHRTTKISAADRGCSLGWGSSMKPRGCSCGHPQQLEDGYCGPKEGTWGNNTVSNMFHSLHHSGSLAFWSKFLLATTSPELLMRYKFVN